MWSYDLQVVSCIMPVMMMYLGYLMGGFLVFVLGFILWAWWQKFVKNRPDLYGKGPGHDLRGAERGQWHRTDKT